MKYFNKHMIQYKLHLMLLALVFSISGVNTELSAQTLEELKQIAAEQNLELKAQYKTFEAKLEMVNQAKAWQDPNLSFGYFISPVETRVGPQVARFSLSQMLPWFGTYKVKGNKVALEAEAEFQHFQDKKLQLFLKVAEKYYELSAIRCTTKLEVKQLEVLKDIKSVVKSNYENNKADLVDVFRVDIQIDKQLSSIDVLKNQDQALVTQLNHLVNQDLKTPIEIVNPLQLLEQKDFKTKDSLSQDHPRLETIRKLQASNEAQVDLAKKQAMPQFGVGLDYVIVQDRNVMVTDAGQDAFMPTISLSLPIFGKKNKSRKKVALLEGESLQLDLENEKSFLQSEIQVTQYKLDELSNLVELHEKQMKRLDDILQLTNSALANAEVDIKEVLRLYEEHLMHHKMKIKTLAELQKTREAINYFTFNNQL